MRDLNGRLDRLAEFVAEGRITVRYALERAAVLALEDATALNDEMLLDVAQAAREREANRCARLLCESAYKLFGLDSFGRPLAPGESALVTVDQAADILDGDTVNIDPSSIDGAGR